MVQFDETKQNEKLARLRKREEEQLAQILSQKYDLPYVDLSIVPIDMDALRIVPEATAREGRLAAFKLSGKELSVAVHSPANPITIEKIEELKQRKYTVHVFMTSTYALESAWDKYKDLSHASATRRGSLDVSSEDVREFLDNVKSLEDAKKFVEETLKMKRSFRTSRIVEVFLSAALAIDASDVHVEPEEGDVRLRFRLDGILTDVVRIDAGTYKMLLSRIKLLSGLKLNVRDQTQDGRFSIKIDTKEIEIRTSIIPSEYGESIVMRLLNPDKVLADIEKLGMHPELLNIVLYEIQQPNGLIITTGPTGSGKTTALYAFLRKVYRPQIKIVTMEDPIEYHMEGIVQTQVNEDRGYSFASGLRAMLRQDPDVVMVGEIRDGDTARIAVNASLTGHVVFSTLHTNNAAGAIPRLSELGVDPSILPSALRVVMAQRLVRVLCQNCKKKVPLKGEARKKIEAVLTEITDPKYFKETADRDYVWEPVGCDDCNGTGYKGRTGIYEAIVMDEKIEEIIKMGATERSLQDGSKHQGILTMQQDGVLKVLKGITSVGELERVVELEELIKIAEDKKEEKGDLLADTDDLLADLPSLDDL